MTQPLPYTPTTNFGDYQTANPASPPLPGTQLDAELAALKTTTDQIRANLALLQRDDGSLNLALVGTDQLAVGLKGSGLVNLTIGPTTTVATGTPASVTNTGTLQAPVLNFSIPQGPPGSATAIETAGVIASAPTTDLSTIATTGYVTVSGNATIASFGVLPAGAFRSLVFTGYLTVTASANMLTLDGADFLASPGDEIVMRSEGGGVWRFVSARNVVALSRGRRHARTSTNLLAQGFFG